MSLVRPGNRPMELRKVATETLAAVVYAVGEMSKAWSHGKYEEGLEQSREAPSKFKEAVAYPNEPALLKKGMAC